MLFFTLSFYLKADRYFRITPFISTCKVQQHVDSLVKSKTVTQEETLNWMLQSFFPISKRLIKNKQCFYMDNFEYVSLKLNTFILLVSPTLIRFYLAYTSSLPD